MGFLRDEPYKVFTAPNGIAGFEILKKEKIDLAVAEMYIAGLNGITLLKRVQAEKIQTHILIIGGVARLEATAEILQTGAVSVLDKPIVKDKFLAKIKKYMPSRDRWKTLLESFLDAHYSNPDLKFEDLMRDFRFSRSYGYALFKKHFGKPFREQLREVRVAHAQRLIKEPLFVNEIASECGFRSSKRLCEAFKRIHGVSPVAYRNSYEQKKLNV